VLKAENSEKENSAKPPLASPEEENREVDRTSAIIPTLNVLVDQSGQKMLLKLAFH
jgi:hypothetical protein